MDKPLDNQDSEFLSVKELAGKLRVSSSTVYGWVELGLIPRYPIGKRIIFKWVEVEEWLKAYHRPGRTVKKPYNSPFTKTLKGVL